MHPHVMPIKGSSIQANTQLFFFFFYWGHYFGFWGSKSEIGVLFLSPTTRVTLIMVLPAHFSGLQLGYQRGTSISERPCLETRPSELF